MTSQRTRAAIWFVAVAGVMLAVLSWLTVVLVQLDGDERDARRQAAAQERLRLALWRMDSWMSPELARESLRPASDYSAFPAAPNAWTRGFSKIGPNEVMVQSPLLGAESELFRLHFEVTPRGVLSPQAPMGNERDFAEANGIDSEVLDRASKELMQLQQDWATDALDVKVGCAMLQLPEAGTYSGSAACDPSPAQTANAPQEVQAQQLQQSVQELDNRRRNFANNVIHEAGTYANPGSWLANAGDTVGPMVPVWIDAPEPCLVFARRANIAGESRVQGVLLDWPRLQERLVSLIADLFEEGSAKIVRCEEPTAEEQPSMMASVPARLVADYRGPVLSADLPVTTILWTTWGVTLLGLCVLGFTLRTAIGFGEKRARFASAVTHELRTPLTTFRMYSEMLADGVVQEPADQRHYLKTLQRESDRLARVVENVLAWSRLEEGRFTARRQRIAISELLQAVVAPLEQRLGEVDLSLDLAVGDELGGLEVETDQEAVGQILFNLADNAAKYAAQSEDKCVRLSASRSGHLLQLTLCDRGPGIEPRHRARIFVPFDRGAVRGSSNEVPGVGLGLPLARGLARDLGGDLRLDAEAAMGACFVLELALADAVSGC